jgi:glucose/arabinose dehydrogenase
MRRLPILLVFLILFTSGCNIPLPATPAPASATQTNSSQATIPNTPVPTPTLINTLPNATTFPDPNGYTWQVIVSHLHRPVDLQADGSGRLFVIEKQGRIRIIENGQLSPDAFLDITDKVGEDGNEQGLLGLAFHPNFSQNGYFYVNYTDKKGDTHISRFQANGNTAASSSELNLLKINQPFPNHNGGALAFGPDGYLYIGLGDGGAAGDPLNNAQNPKSLLGKILRLDVDHGDPYAVPSGNPFAGAVDNEAMREIWRMGLRNPWRFSFDKVTGDFYIGDVGQGDWEEIDYLTVNDVNPIDFGWPIFEGTHHYKGSLPEGPTIQPIAEYSHAEGGCAVTGGYVYRGSMPEWSGIYLYGDYCTGHVWGLIKAGDQWQSQLLFETHVLINSFGQDEKGEIYILTDDGDVYQLMRK